MFEANRPQSKNISDENSVSGKGITAHLPRYETPPGDISNKRIDFNSAPFSNQGGLNIEGHNIGKILAQGPPMSAQQMNIQQNELINHYNEYSNQDKKYQNNSNFVKLDLSRNQSKDGIKDQSNSGGGAHTGRFGPANSNLTTL